MKQTFLCRVVTVGFVFWRSTSTEVPEGDDLRVLEPRKQTLVVGDAQ
jgi:hypothetical protein